MRGADVSADTKGEPMEPMPDELLSDRLTLDRHLAMLEAQADRTLTRYRELRDAVEKWHDEQPEPGRVRDPRRDGVEAVLGVERAAARLRDLGDSLREPDDPR